MQPLYRRFRQEIETEIKRRIIDEHDFHLNRSEIEDVGSALGLGREEATHVFLRLGGTVWVGEVTPEAGTAFYVAGPVKHPPTWIAVHFDIPGMQNRGMLPKPLPGV